MLLGVFAGLMATTGAMQPGTGVISCDRTARRDHGGSGAVTRSAAGCPGLGATLGAAGGSGATPGTETGTGTMTGTESYRIIPDDPDENIILMAVHDPVHEQWHLHVSAWLVA